MHIRDELILISDSSGRVSLINISGDVENDDVYPMLVQPTNINIDWLNDLAYIIDGNRVCLPSSISKNVFAIYNIFIADF